MNPMISFMPYLAFMTPVFYLLVTVAILFLINIWVNRSMNVRKEQNALLREIIQKLDKEE